MEKGEMTQMIKLHILVERGVETVSNY